MHDHPHAYTLPGRLLLIIVILLPIVGTWGTIYLLAESLPGGQYPVFLFAAPYLIISPLVLLLGSLALRRLGYCVRKDDMVAIDGEITALLSPAEESAYEGISPSRSTAFCSTCNKEVVIDDHYRCVHCRWPV